MEYDQLTHPGRHDYETVLAEAEQALDDVDHALKRLDDGTYGTCEMCGGVIGEHRLEELPTARTCEGHPQLTDQLTEQLSEELADELADELETPDGDVITESGYSGPPSGYSPGPVFNQGAG